MILEPVVAEDQALLPESGDSQEHPLRVSLVLENYIERTKSLSMKLPVAPESRRALTEWSSLVSIVPISTGRRRKVPRVSKALIAKSLGSLFSHLGLRSGAGTRGLGGGAFVSSLSIVLGSSIVNTVNLFTSDRGALIAGCAMQNPFLPPGD